VTGQRSNQLNYVPTRQINDQVLLTFYELQFATTLATFPLADNSMNSAV
jgi:hypothetical protein